MKSVRKNAISHLFNKAESLLREPHDSWRCIHINLADTRKTCSLGVLNHFVRDAVEQSLSDQEGLIYFCEDRDVIILFQSPLANVIKKLSRHFAELDPLKAGSRPHESIFLFYDLNQHWKDFFRLCRDKYLSSELSYETQEKKFQYFSHIGSTADLA